MPDNPWGRLTNPGYDPISMLEDFLRDTTLPEESWSISRLPGIGRAHVGIYAEGHKPYGFEVEYDPRLQQFFRAGAGIIPSYERGEATGVDALGGLISRFIHEPAPDVYSAFDPYYKSGAFDPFAYARRQMPEGGWTGGQVFFGWSESQTWRHFLGAYRQDPTKAGVQRAIEAATPSDFFLPQWMTRQAHGAPYGPMATSTQALLALPGYALEDTRIYSPYQAGKVREKLDWLDPGRTPTLYGGRQTTQRMRGAVPGAESRTAIDTWFEFAPGLPIPGEGQAFVKEGTFRDVELGFRSLYTQRYSYRDLADWSGEAAGGRQLTEVDTSLLYSRVQPGTSWMYVGGEPVEVPEDRLRGVNAVEALKGRWRMPMGAGLYDLMKTYIQPQLEAATREGLQIGGYGVDVMQTTPTTRAQEASYRQWLEHFGALEFMPSKESPVSPLGYRLGGGMPIDYVVGGEYPEFSLGMEHLYPVQSGIGGYAPGFKSALVGFESLTQMGAHPAAQIVAGAGSAKGIPFLVGGLAQTLKPEDWAPYLGENWQKYFDPKGNLIWSGPQVTNAAMQMLQSPEFPELLRSRGGMIRRDWWTPQGMESAIPYLQEAGKFNLWEGGDPQLGQVRIGDEGRWQMYLESMLFKQPITPQHVFFGREGRLSFSDLLEVSRFRPEILPSLLRGDVQGERLAYTRGLMAAAGTNFIPESMRAATVERGSSYTLPFTGEMSLRERLQAMAESEIGSKFIPLGRLGGESGREMFLEPAQDILKILSEERGFTSKGDPVSGYGIAIQNMLQSITGGGAEYEAALGRFAKQQAKFWSQPSPIGKVFGGRISGTHWGRLGFAEAPWMKENEFAMVVPEEFENKIDLTGEQFAMMYRAPFDVQKAASSMIGQVMPYSQYRELAIQHGVDPLSREMLTKQGAGVMMIGNKGLAQRFRGILGDVDKDIVDMMLLNNLYSGFDPNEAFLQSMGLSAGAVGGIDLMKDVFAPAGQSILEWAEGKTRGLGFEEALDITRQRGESARFSKLTGIASDYASMLSFYMERHAERYIEDPEQRAAYLQAAREGTENITTLKQSAIDVKTGRYDKRVGMLLAPYTASLFATSRHGLLDITIPGGPEYRDVEGDLIPGRTTIQPHELFTGVSRAGLTLPLIPEDVSPEEARATRMQRLPGVAAWFGGWMEGGQLKGLPPEVSSYLMQEAREPGTGKIPWVGQPAKAEAFLRTSPLGRLALGKGMASAYGYMSDISEQLTSGEAITDYERARAEAAAIFLSSGEGDVLANEFYMAQAATRVGSSKGPIRRDKFGGRTLFETPGQFMAAITELRNQPGLVPEVLGALPIGDILSGAAENVEGMPLISSLTKERAPNLLAMAGLSADDMKRINVSARALIDEDIRRFKSVRASDLSSDPTVMMANMLRGDATVGWGPTKEQVAGELFEQYVYQTGDWQGWIGAGGRQIKTRGEFLNIPVSGKVDLYNPETGDIIDIKSGTSGRGGQYYRAQLSAYYHSLKQMDWKVGRLGYLDPRSMTPGRTTRPNIEEDVTWIHDPSRPPEESQLMSETELGLLAAESLGYRRQAENLYPAIAQRARGTKGAWGFQERLRQVETLAGGIPSAAPEGGAGTTTAQPGELNEVVSTLKSFVNAINIGAGVSSTGQQPYQRREQLLRSSIDWTTAENVFQQLYSGSPIDVGEWNLSGLGRALGMKYSEFSELGARPMKSKEFEQMSRMLALLRKGETGFTPPGADTLIQGLSDFLAQEEPNVQTGMFRGPQMSLLNRTLGMGFQGLGVNKLAMLQAGVSPAQILTQERAMAADYMINTGLPGFRYGTLTEQSRIMNAVKQLDPRDPLAQQQIEYYEGLIGTTRWRESIPKFDWAQTVNVGETASRLGQMRRGELDPFPDLTKASKEAAEQLGGLAEQTKIQLNLFKEQERAQKSAEAAEAFVGPSGRRKWLKERDYFEPGVVEGLSAEDVATLTERDPAFRERREVLQNIASLQEKLFGISAKAVALGEEEPDGIRGALGQIGARLQRGAKMVSFWDLMYMQRIGQIFWGGQEAAAQQAEQADVLMQQQLAQIGVGGAPQLGPLAQAQLTKQGVQFQQGRAFAQAWSPFVSGTAGAGGALGPLPGILGPAIGAGLIGSYWGAKFGAPWLGLPVAIGAGISGFANYGQSQLTEGAAIAWQEQQQPFWSNFRYNLGNLAGGAPGERAQLNAQYQMGAMQAEMWRRGGVSAGGLRAAGAEYTGAYISGGAEALAASGMFGVAQYQQLLTEAVQYAPTEWRIGPSGEPFEYSPAQEAVYGIRGGQWTELVPARAAQVGFAEGATIGGESVIDLMQNYMMIYGTSPGEGIPDLFQQIYGQPYIPGDPRAARMYQQRLEAGLTTDPAARRRAQISMAYRESFGADIAGIRRGLGFEPTEWAPTTIEQMPTTGDVGRFAARSEALTQAMQRGWITPEQAEGQLFSVTGAPMWMGPQQTYTNIMQTQANMAMAQRFGGEWGLSEAATRFVLSRQMMGQLPGTGVDVNILNQRLAAGDPMLTSMALQDRWGQAGVLLSGFDWRTNTQLFQRAGDAPGGGATAQQWGQLFGLTPGGALMAGWAGEGGGVGGEVGLQRAYQAAQLQMSRQGLGISAALQALQYRYTTGEGMPGGRGFWQIEDDQVRLAREQQNYNWLMQGRRMDLQVAQFNENWGAQYERFTQQQAWQREDFVTQAQRMATTRTWARADWARQDDLRATQWGWQMEDFQEQIRFTTGRERRRAVEERRRAVVMYGAEEEQIDIERERQEEKWQWEEEDFNKQKDRAEQMAQWREEDFERQRQQFDENMALSREEHEKTKQFMEERYRLEDEQRRLSREYFKEQHALQQASLGLQAQQIAMQEEMQQHQIAMDDFWAALGLIQTQVGDGLNIASGDAEALRTKLEEMLGNIGINIKVNISSSGQVSLEVEGNNQGSQLPSGYDPFPDWYEGNIPGEQVSTTPSVTTERGSRLYERETALTGTQNATDTVNAVTKLIETADKVNVNQVKEVESLLKVLQV